MNVKPLRLSGRLSLPFIGNTTSENVMIETVKVSADDGGDVILRLYESVGAFTNTELVLGGWEAEAWFCDMMENKEEKLIPLKAHTYFLSFEPFEIKTLRVRREVCKIPSFQ